MACVDMSLEDVIKSRRNTDKGRARRGRPFGAPRRNPLGVNTRPFRRAKNLPWQNGRFEESVKAAGLSGTKLYISNLDSGVSNEDIRGLFSEIGELIRYAIHSDKNGRPSGSAEVVFARRSDAFQALKKYNNVQLDGKPIKIEIIGAPVSARVNVVGKKRTLVMASGTGPGRGGLASATRGRGGGRGRGLGGAQWKKKVEKSADDLDKELETYHAEAMQF